MFDKAAIYFAIATILTVWAAHATPQGTPAGNARNTRTVLDGVYTEAQAARGGAAYLANCSKCHRESLDGTAEALSLKGTRFMEAWRDDTLDGLFLHMKTRMPRRPGGEPGSLKETTYVDILAYILKVNAYPAGENELTTQAIASTLLVGQEGWRPLATNAQIQLVGCLTPGISGTWTLTNASEPVRSRNPEETDGQEIKTAASKPFGNQTFGLRNLTEFRPGFTPDAWQGHKVLVKGVLTRQPQKDRIYVLSLETLAPACTQ